LEHFTLFICDQFKFVMCGTVYIVYKWWQLKYLFFNKLNYLLVDKFTIFIRGPVYTVYMWSSLPWLYVETFILFIYGPG